MEARKVTPAKRDLLALFLIAIGFTLRLLPHAPNFAPVGALALFGGAVLGWQAALAVPLAIMISSDAFIGLYPGVYYTWLGFALVGVFGIALRERRLSIQVVGGALGSGLIFFAVSNFGVWLASGMYPLTWNGFVHCYIMALPFLRISLMADATYALVLFGLYRLAIWLATQHKAFISNRYQG